DLSVELMNTWHVPRSSIKMGNLLGRGNFGEVYEGRWNDTTDVAIKIVRTNSSFDTFMKEVKTMISFKHENVLQIYAVCKEKWPYWIVTELVPYGNMLHYLGRFGHELSEVERLYMAFGIASGMAYLSKKRCIHCDLAGRNILMGQHNICKVADFGLSHKLKEMDTEEYYDATGHVVPFQWMAPEVLIQLKFTRKSDVWSFGVLLYELFTDGKRPYAGDLGAQQVQDLIKCGGRLKRPDACPNVVYHIMQRCWNFEHRKRPPFCKLKREL
uniref:Protein kinase domain-containing protein n=1 Tax=Petromyzon marinus TaxID=7757 RepID=S4RFY2_PETMA